MEEANPFDEFDEEVNPFDEFDTVEGEAPVAEAPAPEPIKNSGFVDTVTDIGSRVLFPLETIGQGVDYIFPPEKEGEGWADTARELANVEVGIPFTDIGTTVDTHDIGKGLVGGAINAAKNVAEFGAAVLPDALSMGFETPSARAERALNEMSPKSGASRSTKGKGGAKPQDESFKSISDYAVQAVRETMPEFHGQNTTQEVSSTISEVGIGIVAGNKTWAAAKAAGASSKVVASLAEKAPVWARYMSKLLTSSASQAAGTAVTTDLPAIAGSDPTIKNIPWTDVSIQEGLPILRGLDGLSESEAQQVLENRFNIFLESAVLAAPVDMIADGGKALFGVLSDSLLRPIRATFLDSDNSLKEGMAMEKFIQNLREAIDPKNPNSKVADEYVSKVISILKDEEQAKIVFPELGSGNLKEVELDPTAIVQRGLADDASERAKGVTTFFDKKRKEVLGNPGVQQTQIAGERPLEAAKSYLDEGIEAKGGTAGIDAAGKAVQTSGKAEVEGAAQRVRDTETALEGAKANYGTIMAEGDATLGKELLDTANAPGSQIGVRRNKITGDIVGAVREGNEALTKANRTKWKNIPEGLGVDNKSLNSALSDAIESNALTPTLKKAFKEAGVDIDAMLGKEATEDMVADFGKLQNSLRLPLSAAIKQAQKSGVGYEELVALRNNITEVQPEWLLRQKQKGTAAGVRAVEEAVADTKDVYGPNAKSGIPGQIKRRDADLRFDKPRADQEAFETIEKAMRSSSSPEMVHLATVLSRPEYGGKANLIVDHAIASAADKMSTALRVDGIVGIKPKEIIDSLAPFRTTLNSNPEKFGKELKRLDDFEKKLLANHNNATKLEELVKEYTKDAAKIRKSVYEEQLKEFFSKEGIPNPDAYRSFKDLFLDKQATSEINQGRLDGMLARIADDPGAKEGAIGAWLKTLKDELFNPDGTLNTTKTAQTLDRKNHFLTIGKKLLGEESEVVDVVEELLNPSLNFQVTKKAPSIKSAESEASAAAAKRAANRLVLATKGPLTKFGGRVTSVVGTVLDWVKPDETNLKIADAIMADRKEFLRVFNDFAKSNVASKNKRRGRELFNWLIKSGIYGEDQSYEDWRKEVDRLTQEAETEEAFSE